MNEPSADRVLPEDGPGWHVGVRRGPAASLHGLVPDGSARVAEWYEVERPALVLGSAQRDEVVDHEAAAAAGVDVVRRRSGGGVVLLMPGESLWLDVVVPRHDPRWDDDVAAAMWWLGDAWCEALHAVGAPSATVHRGALVHTPWSRLVCFDGIGSGEVLVDGHKAVGISQRRTRDWVRLQSSIHLAWQGELLVSLLAPPAPTLADLRPPAVHRGDADALRIAVADALASR
jgi:lipoate-protein ligase A